MNVDRPIPNHRGRPLQDRREPGRRAHLSARGFPELPRHLACACLCAQETRRRRGEEEGSRSRSTHPHVARNALGSRGETRRMRRGHRVTSPWQRQLQHIFLYANVTCFLLQKGMQSGPGGERAGRAGPVLWATWSTAVDRTLAGAGAHRGAPASVCGTHHSPTSPRFLQGITEYGC